MSIYPGGHGWETGSQDWEIVPTDWWRTHYSTVSWVYLQDPAEGKTFQHRQYRGSLFPSSLLVHVTERRRAPSNRDGAKVHEETALNVELVGVKGALEAVLAYERSVGFYCKAFPKIEPEDIESLIGLNLATKIINVEDTRVHQVRWTELVTNLMHSPLPESPSDSDEASELGASSSSVGDYLLHSTSTLSSVDLTSSEGSLESQPMPSTPRAKLSSHNPVEVKDASPTSSIRISPIRSLNASASSFIPTSSSCVRSNDDPIHLPLSQETSRMSSKLSSFADFVFPSLNSPVSGSTPFTSVKLKKDSDGFFTEESSNTTPTLLPPFLQESSQRNQRTRKSRTREIVDRLRSESVPNEEQGSNLHKGRHHISPKYASYSPSPQLLEDFAFSLIKPRRSVSEDGSADQRQHRQTISTSSLSASVSASASASRSRLSSPEIEDDEGWIDIAHSTPGESSPKDKSKRTRELFLALTRRRTDSVSSEAIKETMDQVTTQAYEGATSVVEDSTDISSAPSPSSTPPPTDIIRSVSTSPPMAKIDAAASNDGWIETVHDHSSKAVQKEKVPKKETHCRKKSLHSNPGHNIPLWGRGSAFQPTPPSMPPHPVHQSNISSFLPSSTSTFSHPPIHAPQVMPPPTAPATSPGAIPYFFPSYPMSVRIPPVSSVNYSTAAYNVMQVPNAYPMPPPPPPVPLQSYMAAPAPFPCLGPGGYVHPSQPTSMPIPTKTSFTSAHSNAVAATPMPMLVPVSPGYSSLNGGNKSKW